MKKFIFTESQIKKIIDSEIKETEEKKEFRPGVNLGKYDLKSFIGKKKEDDDEKEGEPKKPFSTNRLKSEKKKED